MKALVSFLLGLLVGAAALWYFGKPENRPGFSGTSEPARGGTPNDGYSFDRALDAAAVREQLSRTGKVIRERARQAGVELADVAANASTTGAIKGKLIQDSGLAALRIDVDTTDGVVTLSGTVPTHEDIARAVNLAWDTDGVIKVVSTLQVKSVPGQGQGQD